MKKTSYISFAIVLILSACGKKKPVELTTETNKKTAEYETIELQPNSVKSIIKLPGELLPFEEVSIFPKLNGFVKEVLVDRGTKVKKGQTLLIMEAPEVLQQLMAAQSKLTELQSAKRLSASNYSRLLETAKTIGSVSPMELDNAKEQTLTDDAKVKSAEANVEVAEAFNSYLTIKAPFDGVITQRDIHPGALVGPGAHSEPLLVLKQEDKLRLTVYVPEIYAEKVNPNEEVSFVVNAFPGKKFKAHVSRMSGSISKQMRSEALELDISGMPEIKSGMYAEVFLPITSGVKSYTVPSSTIVNSTERKYVILLDNNGYSKFVDIKEGISNGDSTEVFGD
jgi:membrane fusion protein (multidrug efflux system)